MLTLSSCRMWILYHLAVLSELVTTIPLLLRQLLELFWPLILFKGM